MKTGIPNSSSSDAAAAIRESANELIAAAIAGAIERERTRCLRIVQNAQPDTSGLSGTELLVMMHGSGWIDLARKAMIRAIENGGGE